MPHARGLPCGCTLWGMLRWARWRLQAPLSSGSARSRAVAQLQLCSQAAASLVRGQQPWRRGSCPRAGYSGLDTPHVASSVI
jgi:hypothetical protein